MSSLNEELSMLKRKLETYNAIVTENDELRQIGEEIEQWKKKYENGQKKVFTELTNTCEIQLEKLKNAKVEECKWSVKLKELESFNDSISCQIETLKSKENKLQSQLTESEQMRKKSLEELRSAKSELVEKNCTAEKLKANLKHKEDELCEIRRKLEHSTKEYDRLKEINGILDIDLKCIKTKLADEKVCAARTEENLTIDRESLSNELKTKCEILNEMETKYNKAICELNDEKCIVRQLNETLLEVNKLCKRNHHEMKSQIQKLQKENCSKEDDLRHLRKKFDKLQQDNEFNTMEICAHKKRLEERECQLKKMTYLSEKIERECKLKQMTECQPAPIVCTDLNAEQIIEKYACTNNRNMTSTVNIPPDLNNLICEFENLKNDVGIDFRAQ